MITAQDIRDVKFGRSLGGYKTDEVDKFLDECAATVEALTNENEENARKMQVLAETVVDYRNQEDSIRSALLNAQRMSDTVVSEAQAKADSILALANEDADLMRERANAEIAAEKAELERIRSEVAAFKTRLLSLYREHLTLIGVLEDEAQEVAGDEAVPETAPAANEEEPVAFVPVDPVEAPIELSLVLGDEEEEEPKIDISAFELKED